jgi:hypothetical protein
MKVSSLIKDRLGNFGVITAPADRPDYVWVLWDCGSVTKIHTQHLYELC